MQPNGQCPLRRHLNVPLFARCAISREIKCHEDLTVMRALIVSKYMRRQADT